VLFLARLFGVELARGKRMRSESEFIEPFNDARRIVLSLAPLNRQALGSQIDTR